MNYSKILFLVLSISLVSCKKEIKDKKNQLTIDEVAMNNNFDSLSNSLQKNQNINQLTSSASNIILTSLDNIRLITIYKINKNRNKDLQHEEPSTFYQNYDETDEEFNFNYFMPGIDVIRGYNLINIAHFNFKTNKLSYFFEKPVLINNLYFPGVKKDSLNNQPIKRNFFLVSVYENDSNNDSIINKNDMRKIYYIDELNTTKYSLLPPNYSAIRSTYDYKNDFFYIYSRFDKNKNGKPEKTEPISIFWVDFNNPSKATKLWQN